MFVHLCRARDLFTDRATPKNLKRDRGEIKGEGTPATNGGRCPPRLETVEQMENSRMKCEGSSVMIGHEGTQITQIGFVHDWSADNCFHRLT